MKILKSSVFVFLLALAACSSDQGSFDEVKENKSEIIGLASPIKLNYLETKVLLSDYFIYPEEITSVYIPNVDCKLDSITFELSINGNISSALDFLEVKTNNNKYHIPVFASRQMNAELRIPISEIEASVLQAKGTFNSWNPNEGIFEKVEDDWVLKMVLNKGAFDYKLVADGAELSDPTNMETVPNGMGGFNNILQVGEKPIKNLLSGLSFQNSKLNFQAELPLENAIATLNNKQIDFIIKENNIEVTIPEYAKNLDESVLRVIAQSNGQVTNEVLVPLSKGKVVISSAELDRSDMHKAIMYFVMVDRFNDAESSNNHPINDDRILPIANNLGGDLQGVTAKINEGYFDNIGINTLWISPITTNPDSAYGLWNKELTSMFSGYHGYWPVRSKEIDYRLGDVPAFKSLINEAHAQEMNVLLDYVANHVHIEHPVYKEHPEWATDLYLPDGTMNTEKWDEQRLTTWFDIHLATLDLRKPEVIEPMTDTALYWLTEYELDGFRHDATKHIPEQFWRTLTTKIKQQVVTGKSRPIYQVGETYGSPELVSGYVQSGQLDAQFDFNLYDAAINAFAKDESGFQNLRRVLEESMTYYGAHHLMVNVTGNQDKARFASYADGSLKFDEDTKLAGWTREIKNANEKGFKRMRMMSAFLNAIPGIPCTYYGDEIAMPGGNDPDNRRMMKFAELNDSQLKTKESLTVMNEIRTNHMALIYGSTNVLESSDNMLRISRTYFGEEVQFIFYKGNEDLEFSITNEDLSSIKLLAKEDVEIREEEEKNVFSMKPWSFIIVETKNQ